MKSQTDRRLRRREFLGTIARGSAAAGLALSARSGFAASQGPGLEVGEGVVDTTPPLGIEMGGFHRQPGNERRIRAIRQSTAARALVLKNGDTKAAILSLDLCAVPDDVAGRMQKSIAAQTGIPAENIRICCTHTHSMPAFCYTRQWGAVPENYMATVEKLAAEAVLRAQADLAPAELYLGKSRAEGANFNRTTKTWKTDAEFTSDSTDDQRWLDTMLHVMRFQRAGPKRDLVWYHFSAHAVCFADEEAGPDWPGMVAQRAAQEFQLTPSYLQGHAGDVNPGDGTPWRGDAEETTKGAFDAFSKALEGAKKVEVDQLQASTETFGVPLDMELFKNWLARYQEDPAKCTGGEWVDAGFAKDWFEGNHDRELSQTHLPITLSALRLGELALVFHPAELYSYYGLAIRRDSPFADTIVVGYTDGIIGYLPDPNAYKAGEYAAMTVPKILDFPPFVPTAAREMTAATVALLNKVAT